MRSGIARLQGTSVFNFFEEPLHTVSIVAALTCNPTNSALGFLFLHILTNTCCLSFIDGSHFDSHEVIILLWF